MFFFFFGGLAPKLKRLPTSLSARCPNCLDRTPTMHQYLSEQELTIFFMPIASFGKKTLWVCENCHWTEKNRPDEERIRQIEQEEMTQQPAPLPTWGIRTCPSCQKEINVSGRFRFCPYCGNEIQR
ncbi:11220_t:CDS:2 [Ambispora gerdemannii]|uniref:11220_t:CDS:1 n=1 Tax=Ambispora gerdemannii TaxID=144530 RepID=A0A9N8VMW0_9GLOM|nr:11220_t:CDS:2 [Ambispora gerdemannii]